MPQSYMDLFFAFRNYSKLNLKQNETVWERVKEEKKNNSPKTPTGLHQTKTTRIRNWASTGLLIKLCTISAKIETLNSNFQTY